MEHTSLRTNSRTVSSNQHHVHPKLARLVLKHLASTYRRPVAGHNRDAYQRLCDRLAQAKTPLVLDSFCGTGHSTLQLARQFPDALVVGVDKSARRLARRPEDGAENLLFLQADCEDIWQQLVADGHQIEHHYLFYPNPWPKAKHLQRRVHGHGSFPLLLKLGGSITLRSNWQIYVEEFGLALHLCGRHGVVSVLDARQPISLFERKYQESNHILWQYQAAKLENAAP